MVDHLDRGALVERYRLHIARTSDGAKHQTRNAKRHGAHVTPYGNDQKRTTTLGLSGASIGSVVIWNRSLGGGTAGSSNTPAS